MEGEADRREDGDPPEGQSDGLEGLREEIRERYPESGKEDQGGVPPDSGEASEDVDSAPETKLEENAPKAERSREQSNQSSDAKEKSEPNAEVRSGVANQEGSTVEHSEQNAEPESWSELDKLRDELREKHPQGEVNESSGHDVSDPVSQSEDKDVEGTNSQFRRRNHEEKSETAIETADERAALAPQEGGKDGVAEEDGKPPYNGGGKIDVSQLDLGNGAKVERSARQAGSDGLEDAVGEALEQSGEASGAVNSRSNNRETKDASVAEGLNIREARVQEVGNRNPKAFAKELPEKRLESNDNSFAVNETKRGPSHYLRIPNEQLSKFGKDDVLEARATRLSEPDKEFKLYTSSGYADPHLNISFLNPSPRESFQVLSLRKFESSDFVQDFNEHKPKAFENVTLSNSDGAVAMKVDNLTSIIQNPKFSVRGQGPILEGTVIQGTSRGNIRIAKEVESFSLHFGDLDQPS